MGTLMKRTWFFRVAMLLLLSGVGVGGYLAWRHWRKPREPLIGSKTKEAWLADLRSPDPVLGREAALALADLGEAGLSLLLEARKDADLRVHRRAVTGLVRLGAKAAPGLVEVLPHGGARVETALVRIGPPALPALQEALGSAEQAKPAARVLGGMGERARPAVPALVGLLQNLSAGAEARAEAAAALGWIGPEKPGQAPLPEGADEVVGALVAALSGPGRVRLQAVQALGLIGSPARSAVSSLVRLVRDPDVEVSAAACNALGQIGGPAAVEPLVTRLLKGDAASKPAALALARLGPTARLGVAPLIGVLKSEKEDGQFARAVLERLGATAVPDLEEALKQRDVATRRAAAEVLGLMGPRAAAVGPALVQVLRDADASVAVSAARALVRIEPDKAAVAVPVLVKLFADKNEKVATAAALVLADSGPDVRAALPTLLAALQSKDEKAIRRAAYVLGRMRRVPAEGVARLRSALAGPAAARPAVVQALGMLGGAAKDSLPDLPRALKDPPLRPKAALAMVLIDPLRASEAGRALVDDLSREGSAQLAALAALAAMPRVPAEVVPALRPLLADRSLVRSALEVVRQLEPKALPQVIPDLVMLLSDSDGQLRKEAGLTLRLIGRPALPALKRALSSPSPRTRATAAWALDWPPLYGSAPNVDFLLPLLEDKEESVRQQAAATCGDLGVRSPEAVEAMLALLASAEVDLRRSAVRALRGVWWEKHEQLAPHLVECLLDPDEEVRQASAEALRAAGKALPGDIAAALKEALHDQSPAVRLAAADALSHCRASAAEAELAPVLLALARGATPADRRVVLGVLFDVSPARARELRDQVEADLRGESVEDRTEAGEWLLRLDKGAADKVLPFLVGILNGWNTTARYQAVLVLERLGTLAKPALPALKRRAENDEVARVRTAARRALGKIEPSHQPR
jgi:HEAT repeat protein